MYKIKDGHGSCVALKQLHETASKVLSETYSTGGERGLSGLTRARQINILGIPCIRLRTFTKYELHIYGRPSRPSRPPRQVTGLDK